MDRRAFLETLAGSVLAAPLTAGAQQTAKVSRIGFLTTCSLSESRMKLDASRQGLRQHGYLERQNIVIECRAADRELERPRSGSRSDAYQGQSAATPAARAAQQATATIPCADASM